MDRPPLPSSPSPLPPPSLRTMPSVCEEPLPSPLPSPHVKRCVIPLQLWRAKLEEEHASTLLPPEPCLHQHLSDRIRQLAQDRILQLARDHFPRRSHQGVFQNVRLGLRTNLSFGHDLSRGANRFSQHGSAYTPFSRHMRALSLSSRSLVPISQKNTNFVNDWSSKFKVPGSDSEPSRTQDLELKDIDKLEG